MWNPIKSFTDMCNRLFENYFERADFKPPENDPFAQFEAAAKPAEPEATKFERALMKRFNTWRDHENYKAIMVSIDPARQIYTYEDPLTGFTQKADFQVSAVESSYSYEEIIRREHRDAGRMVVMLLDLHGPSLEEQIPGWKLGTMEFPDHFLSCPLISVPNPSGLLVQSKGLMGIDLNISMPEPRNVSIRGQLAVAAHMDHDHHAEDALPGFKPAIGRNTSGKTYMTPPNIIRGVFTNDMK